MPRREFEAVSLSFMDLICCGLGGMLVFMLILSSLISNGVADEKGAHRVSSPRVLIEVTCSEGVVLEVQGDGARLTRSAAGPWLLLMSHVDTTGSPERAVVSALLTDASTPPRGGTCELRLVGPESGNAQTVDVPRRISSQRTAGGMSVVRL